MELLAPAGDKQKLIMAIHYGADAVYLASTRFGLRTFAGNFDLEELKEAVEYAHERNVKVYVTVNIIPHESDLKDLPEYIKYLEEIKVDAVICADLGVISIVRRVAPNLHVHVSTQANITNSESAMVYVNMGVKRLILAREMTIEEIKELREKIPGDIELEAFAHGAMCISYSGRCLLSNFFTGRDANRGACVQACRWNYEIREINKEQYYPIEEDMHGTYILNSKDMCMINHLDKMRDAGISSIKIEGRMKTEYYVANVVNAYRLALDYLKNNKNYSLPDEIKNEVYKSSHRDYSEGFYFGNPKESLDSSLPVMTHDFIAVVLEDTQNGTTKVEMRNKFGLEELELLSKEKNNAIIKIEKIFDVDGNELEFCNIPKQVVYIRTNQNLKKLEILRREKVKEIKSVLVIYNPNAMKGKIGDKLPHIKQRLQLRYEKVETVATPVEGAEEVALSFAPKYDMLVSCGGDGTLHEIINGVMKSGSQPTIGILPFGTCNDVARTFKIPFDLDEAIDCILRLNTTAYDIMFDGKDYITYALATGYLTEASYSASSKVKKKIGRLAYVFTGIRCMFNFKALPLTVTCDNERIHGKFVYMMAMNGESTGGFKLNKGAIINNEKVKIVMIKKARGCLFTFIKLFLFGIKSIMKSKNAIVREVKNFEIENHSNTPFTSDGEKTKFLKKKFEVKQIQSVIKF